MPPAVVAAGIGGLTTLGGALIGSGAQKNALKAQQQGSNQALQYQRERDAANDKRYERDYAEFQRKTAAREATQRAIAKHYGLDMGPAWAGVGAGSPSGSGAGPAPAPRPAGPMPGPAPGPAPMSAPMSSQPAGMAPGPSAMTPEPEAGPAGPGPEMSSWNDWGKYGLR